MAFTCLGIRLWLCRCFCLVGIGQLQENLLQAEFYLLHGQDCHAVLTQCVKDIAAHIGIRLSRDAVHRLFAVLMDADCFSDTRNGAQNAQNIVCCAFNGHFQLFCALHAVAQLSRRAVCDNFAVVNDQNPVADRLHFR